MTTRTEAYDLYKNDYQSVDGVETLTLATTDSSGDPDSVTTVKGKRIGPEKPPLAATDRFSAQPARQKWRLWDVTLDGYEPHTEDTLTVGGVTYTIESVRREHWDTQWVCDCIRQVS